MKQRRSSSRSKTGTSAGRRRATASRSYASHPRTIHGRYSDFEVDSDRSYARGGYRGEFASPYDQDYYGDRYERSPRRSIDEDEFYYSPRGSTRSRGYSNQERGYMDRDYEDQGRMSYRGYNDQWRQESDRDMERRYSSGRNENFRGINSREDEDYYNDDYGFRERYDQNRY